MSRIILLSLLLAAAVAAHTTSSVQANGTGTITATPDKAEVSVGVVTQGTTADDAAQQPLATRYASRSLIVLFAINILNFYDRGVLVALAEPVRKEFSLSDTQLGFITTAFTLLYAVIGVPLGRVADL